MTASAHDIAAVLRQRLPGLDVLRLHKLLYYCQGHHLAAFGEPLFTEEVFAWDNGPVISKLWKDERDGLTVSPRPEIGEAELNTIGYVISRYGKLTPNDLINMTHQEAPWRLANASRMPGGTKKIGRDWLKGYFSTDGAPSDGIDEPFDSAEVTAWLREAVEHDDGSTPPDDLDRLRSRVTGGF
ncbi:Panacea domain-containing protein [Phytohabitans flavus]|uniref:Panacea domain-containing protein n=1 Tax=Phytohabitans flavus TaxID=1076124 RepID=UPI00156548C3|nr:Panacea domain-containing protein [Phytohabitans flavus]